MAMAKRGRRVIEGPAGTRSRGGRTPRIGEKKGSKRHLVVDERGVPLSIIVTAANVNDVTQLGPLLQAIVVARPDPEQRRSKHLCADAGYQGRPAREIIESHRYIAHVARPRKDLDSKRRDPKKKARRWVVEASHSWFTRFRKLLVRYEKLHRSYMALTHLAAAIIAFRKIEGVQNIIYG